MPGKIEVIEQTIADSLREENWECNDIERYSVKPEPVYISDKFKELKRIPYEQWSQQGLSVARFYGGIKINSDYYEFDHKILQQMHDDNDDSKLYKPDLVLYDKKKK